VRTGQPGMLHGICHGFPGRILDTRVKIRPATKQAVARFFRTVIRTRMRFATELLSADRLQMADECFVAIINRKIVGAVCIVYDNGTHAELLTEYVLKEYQGQGIGTSLSKTAILRLIELGRTPIDIDVTSKGMDRTLDKLPRALHRRLRLNRSYLKFGEVDLPEM
jgi:GNAT superfamily N-acetyltransferase